MDDSVESPQQDDKSVSEPDSVAKEEETLIS